MDRGVALTLIFAAVTIPAWFIGEYPDRIPVLKQVRQWLRDFHRERYRLELASHGIKEE